MIKKIAVYLLVFITIIAGRPANASAADSVFGNTIASGDGRVLAIQEDGSLWYWGRATFNDFSGDQSPERASKTKIMNDVISVFGNWFRSFALKSDHSLWDIASDEDDNGITKPVKLMDGVKEATASYSDILILKTDGTIWEKYYYSDNDEFKQVLSGVKEISANLNCFYALKEDGTLWGWGENNFDGLGVKTPDTLVDTPVEIMKDVKSVHGIGLSALAVKTDNTLWGWGDNEDGILSPGEDVLPNSDEIGSTRRLQSSPVKLMEDVWKVDGKYHIAVIKNDRSLWTWGFNEDGEFGDGTSETSNVPRKVQDNVEDVTARGMFMMFLKSDGSLWGSGSNGVGELSLGAFDNDPHPTPILIMEHVAIPGTTAAFPSIWARDDIQFAKETNLVPADMQKEYHNNITRGEFVSIIVPLIETISGMNLDTFMNVMKLNSADPFSDVDDKNVLQIAGLDIINGFEDGKFRPDDFITREQAAIILMRTANLLSKGADVVTMGIPESQFSDGAAISSWAERGVYFCTMHSIMSGTGDNYFSPKDPYTREMSIVTVSRLFRMIAK